MVNSLMMVVSSDFIKYAVSIRIDEPTPNRGKGL
jgi:hypothetical protein